MTIAKSQGSSLPCVVVSPTTQGKSGRKSAIKREELYVGCSRATSLEGLFINGTFKKPAPPKPNDVVTKEMENLKNRPIQFSMLFLQDFTATQTTVFFMNAQSLKKHHKDIIADSCPMSSSFLAFVEPHMIEDDDLEFNGYRYAHRSNSSNRHRSDGSILLVHESLNYPTVHVETFSHEAGHCLCVSWTHENINFIMSYRSPKCSITAFKRMITNIIEEKEGDVLFFGDINIDLSKSENQPFVDFMASFNMESKLNVNEHTTDSGTHIDCLFSNVTAMEACLYETYYSHHKAICMILPKY